MFVPDVCQWEQGRERGGTERGAYHFFIGQLSSLDAATVSDSLLMSFALGVAEQVHLWGDLQTQTQWSEVTAVDTKETEAEKGPQGTQGMLVIQYTSRARQGDSSCL